MKLSIAIVGLPNVGKSTLFKILTNQEVNIANYPFATIDPNVGIVPVPDERLEKLAEISHSKKIVPAVVEFYDIAGLVKGANKGEGLGNQFLAHIRETRSLIIVLRIFKDPEIIHVENSVDPIRDLEIINLELILKDLETVEKRLNSLEKESKSGDKLAVKNLPVLKQVHTELLKNNLALKFAEEKIVHELQLLTAKKQLYLLNGEESEVGENLKEKIKSLGADYLTLNLKSETQPTDDHQSVDLGKEKLIQKAYAVLDLISFLTTGEDETRAWTIQRGTRAPEAAGVIHTDFEAKFIRAEIINWQKLLEAGSWQQAKLKGFLRLEGKEYVVQDGDVIVIRHG